jgi:hypothetical protein
MIKLIKKLFKMWRDWEFEEVIIAFNSNIIVTNNITIEFFIIIFLIIFLIIFSIIVD